MTDLSIIILNYNTPNLVKQCLKNIKKSLSAVVETHNHASHNYTSLFGDWEIILIDNGSKNKIDLDQPSFEETWFANIKIIHSPQNRGFAAGHNLGLASARGRYVLILNPDIVVLNDAILKMRQFMEARQKIAILGPGLLNPDRIWQYSCHRFPKFWTPLFTRTVLGKTKLGKKELTRYNMLDYDHQEPRAVDCLFGAALMIRKDFLDKAGGFNEKYFLYYEDIDLCRRAWSLSLSIKSALVKSTFQCPSKVITQNYAERKTELRGKEDDQSKFQVWYLPQAQMFHYHKRLSARKSLWHSIFNKVFWIHISSHLKYFSQWGIGNSKFKI